METRPRKGAAACTGACSTRAPASSRITRQTKGMPSVATSASAGSDRDGASTVPNRARTSAPRRNGAPGGSVRYSRRVRVALSAMGSTRSSVAAISTWGRCDARR